MGDTTQKRAQGKGSPKISKPAPNKDKFYFGTPAEVSNRISTGYGSKDPSKNAPKFTQIQGGDAGKNLNDPSFTSRSGNFKFSQGV